MIRFDSDYMEGAHPQIMRRLLESNMEQTSGYGEDRYTQRAKELIIKALDCPDARVQFMVGGTQTNATIIDGILLHHEGVLAAESGHISVHESGAIEASGHKVLTLPEYEGKVRVEDVERFITTFYADRTYPHMVAPGMLYISQPTEYGTIYSLDELKELSESCRRHDIPLYIDGARLGYALAARECDFTLKDIARLADAFYIGGTKVGALFGEAVVITNPKLVRNLFPLVKQHGALLAKGRLLGLQFETLFEDDLYTRIARNAVELALQIKEGFISKGYECVVNSPTNQQFFRLPNDLIDRLRQKVGFELWGARGESHSTVRFVTSWATSPDSVRELLDML